MTSGIYKWTSPSGKSYIGQAINLKKRWREFRRPNSIYTSKGSAIDNARSKYHDFEKWTYEVLEECDIEELDVKEIYWINYFDTYNFGYNSTSGGDGTKGHTVSEELKEKARQRMLQAHKDGKYLKWQQSEEARKLTSERFRGRVWTEEQKKQISESLKGNILSEETKSKISDALKLKYADGFINENRIAKISKKVNMYDLEGNLIKTFDSISKTAAYFNKKDGKMIRKVCQGKKDSVYGYKFQFA